MSSWLSAKVEKGVASRIEGRGLFARERIAHGEVVAVKGGHIVASGALRQLPDRLQNSEIQITDDLHLVALSDDEYEPVMLFLNHSCEPNVGFSGNVVLVAMRDVETGEELTTDYALFDTASAEMPCTCGTPRCRGTVTGQDWRRGDLQARYRGYFSTYLQRRIERAAGGDGGRGLPGGPLDRRPLTTEDLERASGLVAAELRAVDGDEWARPIPGLAWTCEEAAEHLVSVLLGYAAQVAGRASERFLRVQASPSVATGRNLVDLVEPAGRLLVLALEDLPPGARIFHPAGLADAEGYVAMAIDELLVHGAEITAAAGHPVEPPGDLAARVVARLFPWAPPGSDGWAVLRWANDRDDLADHQRPGPSWVWHCRPLDEWDGSVPRWGAVS